MSKDNRGAENADLEATTQDAPTDDATIEAALEQLPEFGEVTLDESGLALPIDANAEHTSAADSEEAIVRPVTAEEMRALAETEAELDLRWPETKIDPSMERIELLMDLSLIHISEPTRLIIRSRIPSYG